MKLIKQKKLYFSEGKSDKVYEVDLCENQDLFVVNFRYGRRGSNLREGTKTVFPVVYEEAEKIFNNLVESKERKGYSENPDGTLKPTKKPIKKQVNTAREETILKYLQQAINGTYTRNWAVSRIILRAGSLHILSSANLVAEFIQSKDRFEQYNAIATLASFENAEYSQSILEVFKQQKFQTITGRISCAYLLKFGNKSQKEEIKKELSNSISEDTVYSLPMLLMNNNNPLLLYYAYVFSFNNESLREKLYQVIERLPLKVNNFKSIRYIYRASQVTKDLTFFALISKRIAISNPGYTSEYLYINDNWISVFKEKQKENPSIAFSGKTKDYFNRTTYKKVYELSQNNTDDYVKYVTELLCTLSEEDGVKEDIQYLYNYNFEAEQYENEKRYYPKYHNFLALLYILYGNSNRFQQQKNKWYFLNQLEDNSIREEALSHIWDEKPNEVLHILANSKSNVAVDFSLRILKDNPHFLDTLSEDLIAKLVKHYNSKVLELITDVLENKYANTQPKLEILLALLKSKNEKVVKKGLNWLEKHKDSYLDNDKLIIELLLTNEVLVINYLHSLYADKNTYPHALKIEELQPLFSNPNNFSFDFLVKVNSLIGNTHFGELLRNTPASKITELSNSPLTTNKLFAINLAKRNTVPTYQLFKDSFDEYIKSDKEELRRAGIELLAHFPDSFLLENSNNIVSFCFSEHKEVREAVQPTVERLIKLDANFKEGLLNKLLITLTGAEVYEGLHKNCYELLTKYFDKNLSSISEEQIIQLILSKYEFAQKLGAPIFENRVSLSSLSMPVLISLAHSDVLVIREKLHTYFNQNIPRVNYELEEALPIFNTDWQDVIDWSCAYFDEKIDSKNWTVEMLLYACDHVKEDVQSFGRKMVTKYFSEEKGLPLLLKLQEHPTKNMQFFVTNYLDAYAKNNVEVILKLEHYFKTSLFNINTHRATKTRIYSFLEQESLKNEEVAKMTVRIINSILDTKTIKDKSKNIDVLLAIKEAYLAIEVPLQINELTNEV